MAPVTLKSQSIALDGPAVDKLIARGSGDAALLYLYLLRTGGQYSSQGAQAALGWNNARIMSAFQHLVELELVEDNTPPERRDAPRPEDCPDYSTADITSELTTQGSQFSQLLEEVEHLLGKKCSLTETRILLELYDHLAMPTEVLLIITARQIEETQQRLGPGRKPRMSEIKAMAYRWKKLGVDTLEKAEDRLKKLNWLKSQEGALLQAVGVSGRMAVDGEMRYLHQWAEWGFSPEAARMAYERTVMRKGAMNWGYCTGILRRWHEKGAHTPEEILAADQSAKPRQAAAPARPGSAAAKPDSARETALRMKKLLEMDE